MSPTAAMNVVAVIRRTPDTGIRRLTASEPSACSAMTRSRIAIAPSRKSIWRRHPSTGLALVAGQRERGQPRPAALAECVAHRRPALEGAHQHRVNLVLGTCALSDELR